MSKTNFTPGLWSATTGGFSSCADYKETFSVNGPPSDFMYLEKIEDARLIAAAPDMYEALELLERLMTTMDGFRMQASDLPSTIFAGEMVEKAKAALAKARGEQQ